MMYYKQVLLILSLVGTVLGVSSLGCGIDQQHLPHFDLILHRDGLTMPVRDNSPMLVSKEPYSLTIQASPSAYTVKIIRNGHEYNEGSLAMPSSIDGTDYIQVVILSGNESCVAYKSPVYTVTAQADLDEPYRQLQQSELSCRELSDRGILNTLSPKGTLQQVGIELLINNETIVNNSLNYTIGNMFQLSFASTNGGLTSINNNEVFIHAQFMSSHAGETFAMDSLDQVHYNTFESPGLYTIDAFVAWDVPTVTSSDGQGDGIENTCTLYQSPVYTIYVQQRNETLQIDEPGTHNACSICADDSVNETTVTAEFRVYYPYLGEELDCSKWRRYGQTGQLSQETCDLFVNSDRLQACCQTESVFNETSFGFEDGNTAVEEEEPIVDDSSNGSGSSILTDRHRLWLSSGFAVVPAMYYYCSYLLY